MTIAIIDHTYHYIHDHFTNHFPNSQTIWTAPRHRDMTGKFSTSSGSAYMVHREWERSGTISVSSKAAPVALCKTLGSQWHIYSSNTLTRASARSSNSPAPHGSANVRLDTRLRECQLHHKHQPSTHGHQSPIAKSPKSPERNTGDGVPDSLKQVRKVEALVHEAIVQSKQVR